MNDFLHTQRERERERERETETDRETETERERERLYSELFLHYFSSGVFLQVIFRLAIDWVTEFNFL